MTRVKWREPKAAKAVSPHHLLSDANFTDDQRTDLRLTRAESLYATAIDHENECWDSCVDLYFEVATLTQCCANDVCSSCRECELHKSALAKLVTTGQEFNRLDARSRLIIHWESQKLEIPVTHHGFPWNAEDFERLEPVGDYRTNALQTIHRTPGIGIPLVVTKATPDCRPFLTQVPTFAATLVLRAGGCGADDSQAGGKPTDCVAPRNVSLGDYSLELYDPLRIDHVDINNQVQTIAKDISAPLAFRLRNQQRTILNNFIDPSSASGESRLLTLEPYQPGKVPVLFIHGLLSDPFTWVEMVNELQATEGVVDRFQFWFFEYPTGRPFLESAAQLREQLEAAYNAFDAEGSDQALSNTVLVGHSMGGLVANLQIASSGDRLWRSVANRPLEEVITSAQGREQLSRSAFFEPSSRVSRVIYIGTPHRGSAYARRFVGKLGSALVREPEQSRLLHQELIACNPGVFSRELSKRIPTSIDLLEPKSPLLNAIADLPISNHVHLHSIIGDKCGTLGLEPSDGVVPVSSARDFRARSERFVNCRHEYLSGDPDAIDEVRCILVKHLQTLESNSLISPMSPPHTLSRLPASVSH